MRTSFIASGLVAVTAAAMEPRQTPVPDPSAVFFAQLYNTVADCKATTGVRPFLYSRGACRNIRIPGSGSAKVIYNERPDTLTLSGWTGKDCTGDKVVIGASVGECVSLDGKDIASWSHH
ncbi:hypothetical protein DL766_001524 [Monosporascus sp. MC13-8B]|uniref:Uncharacterized protein n=1 Tax=Monosporascus cannonballus TaxID=155416 RepID=A0ABY0HM38_9PEZI|nr:hypothetical protein DL763_007333 [Monosporascus cannonballus]RYO93761.1 hypothetical protein DL762_000966 [Monosporascus cannonballus]RYP37373.1 hypothetical protein DL766_001524 [Monosporascus sp. MC13-8B]